MLKGLVRHGRAGLIGLAILGLPIALGAPAEARAPYNPGYNLDQRYGNHLQTQPKYQQNVTPRRRFRKNYTSRPRVRHHRAHRPAKNLAAGIVRSKAGVTARVHPSVAANFQCLIDRLDAVGYPIKFMGGYGKRPGNYSLHPSGRALDINQVARNRWVGGRFPANINAMARSCGLFHGAEWAHADGAHFQIATGRISLWPIARVQDAVAAAVAPPIRQEVVTPPGLELPEVFAEYQAKEYLIRTAKAGFTMTKQGVAYSIDQLHPVFAIRLAAAIKEARAAGLAKAGVSSAYRKPELRVGGWADKHASLHAYGLAVDMFGIGSPNSQEWRVWHEIATRHKLVNPYVGTASWWEFNHYQVTGVSMIAVGHPLRKTITKAGPPDMTKMWNVANRFLDKPVTLVKASATKIGFIMKKRYVKKRWVKRKRWKTQIAAR